jgi:hypothetical protein
MSHLESAVVRYLEGKGYTPEYSATKTRFRHPQRASRLVSLERLTNQTLAVYFTNCLESFAEKWRLSSQGELPTGFSLLEIQKTLDDFFLLEEEKAPPGSPPFEVRLKEVSEILHRYASRNKRDHHYELSYEDLVQIGRSKVYEVWLHYGDKPLGEFQCLVARSLQRRIDSLLSKHYVSKRRSGAEIVSLSPEMTEVLPEESFLDPLADADWLGYAANLLPAQRILLEHILNPPAILRRDCYIEDLRYRTVRAQFPKSRLLSPKFNLAKIAEVTGLPVEELKKAYDTLQSTIETDAFNDLIQSINNE